MKPQNVIHILMAIVCFALSPQTRAVDPPHTPDPPPLSISNTADGDLALVGATGIYNSAFGFYALLSNGAASFNTGIGAGTLLSNTEDGNTAVGAGTLFSNTTGPANTGCGTFALFTNTTGEFNTAVGANSLFNNTTGSFNSAFGANSLDSNTTGQSNTAVGDSALSSNVDGSENSALGLAALAGNVHASSNTAVGHQALSVNDLSGSNKAFGNTAVGHQALQFNGDGFLNTAVGFGNLQSNEIGQNNTAIGSQVLQNSTSDGNTALGATAGFNVTTAEFVIAIGSVAANVSNSCFIGNTRGVTTANADAIPVLIDSAGQLGTVSSSRRFKHDIEPMDKASESVLALKPVTFHYKSDKTATAQFGLIAEEVAKVNPDLVVRDKDGDIYTVRYDAVNAMLLSEFLKEHRKNEDQEKTIAELKSGMTALIATVKEQAAQIQKVSAQLESSKPAPQVVNNP